MGFSVAGSAEAGVRKKSPLAKPPRTPRKILTQTPQSPQKGAGVVMMQAAAVPAAGSKKPSRKTRNT